MVDGGFDNGLESNRAPRHTDKFYRTVKYLLASGWSAVKRHLQPRPLIACSHLNAFRVHSIIPKS
ncbi:MAG: hypothetical protein ABFS43_00765 [Thermodesulfobacteriota bacterium]